MESYSEEELDAAVAKVIEEHPDADPISTRMNLIHVMNVRAESHVLQKWLLQERWKSE